MKHKVHISPKPKRIEHKPVSRLLLFLGAICISVLVLNGLHLGHSEHSAVATLSVGAVINRGLEVLTDVICDRLFPELF